MDEETKDQTTQQQEDQQTGEGEQNSAGRGMTFDEWLDSDPALRSEFDRRNTKAVQTARSKWEQEQADHRRGQCVGHYGDKFHQFQHKKGF